MVALDMHSILIIEMLLDRNATTKTSEMTERRGRASINSHM
jgi:hypothetical protein